MDSLPRSSVCLLGSRPGAGDLRQGLVPLQPGTAGYHSLVEHRNSQVPGGIHPLPLPRSPIPAGPTPPHLNGHVSAAPRLPKLKAPAFESISGLNHAASVTAAYASRGVLPHPMQGSLPVGG